jgi:hypothetical protein
MADEAVLTQEAPAGEIIRGSGEELNKRLTEEPGFFEVYSKAYSEGRVEITDKPVGEVTPEVKVEVAAVVVPEAKVEVKSEPAKPVEPQDEDITVTLKKSQLGNFKTIGEKLKSADEAQSLVNFLKTETARVKAELEAGTATVAENARLKQELADLKTKTVAATTVATEKAIDIKPDPKAIEEMVTFDDFDGLDKDALEAKLFEADTQMRIIKASKQTAGLAKYAKSVDEYARKLEAELAAMKSVVAETSKKQEEFFTQQTAITKQKESELANETLFASMSEWQARTPDLKTQLPLKELNAKYIGFVDNLKLAVNPKSQKELEDALTRYFYDESEVGDKLRADCVAKGIVPPEENDKFLQIMDIKRIAESTKLPLDEAYAAYKVRNKIKAPDPSENQRVQAAIEQRSRAAATMDSTKVNADSPADMGEDATIGTIIEKYTPSEIKKDEALRKRVDAYCERNGFPLYSWEKYN